MAEQFSQLSDGLIKFIENQHIFFSGTAASSGRVNISPKGIDSLRVQSANEVIWQNFTGSGNETAAHLLDNNRLTLMFCSFDKKPLILRLYGKARAVHPRDDDWQKLTALFPDNPGTRQFYIMDIDMVQTSCGFAVPYMEFTDDRRALDQWTEQRGEDGLKEYWEEKNQRSLDGFETDIFGGHS